MRPREMMGFDIPGDQKVPVPVRDWNAMKIAAWRMKTALLIAEKQATEMIALCVHSEGCAGAKDETASCSLPCRDREMRLSALVIVNAARRFAPINFNRPADEPFFAPSREYYSEVLADFAAATTELAALRALLRAHGIEAPSPPTDPAALPVITLAPQLPSSPSEESP